MTEQGLRAALLADAAVSGLVAKRVYPHVLPQKPRLPAMTYSRVAAPRDVTTSGPDGTVRVRVQLDCWAQTYAEAWGLANAVRKALQGLRDDALLGVFMDAEREMHEPGLGLYRVVQDWGAWGVEETA